MNHAAIKKYSNDDVVGLIQFTKPMQPGKYGMGFNIRNQHYLVVVLGPPRLAAVPKNYVHTVLGGHPDDKGYYAEMIPETEFGTLQAFGILRFLFP